MPLLKIASESSIRSNEALSLVLNDGGVTTVVALTFFLCGDKS